MVLDTFMYLNYKEAGEGATLRDIVKELKFHPDCGGGGIHSGEYTILEEAVLNDEIGNLSICCQSANMGYDSGTAACVFKNPDESSIYVVYRGTGDGEWPDNGIGMTSAATLQQKNALAYFEEVVEYMNISKDQHLIVTGHSKGGNKAQFVTMETKYGNLVDVCYSVDGQGFSEAAVDKWQERYDEEEYAERREKIYGICGENDYVSVLGNSIIPKGHIRYIETPVEKSNFAGYHDIKYMFAALCLDGGTGKYVTVFHGRKNRDVGGRGELGEYAAALSGKVMGLPPDQRDGCAAVIMQLMEASAGSIRGINGEKLTMSDLKDFTLLGVPLISDSLFMEREGSRLLRSFMEKETLSGQISGELAVQADTRMLRSGAYKLKEMVQSLEKLAGEIKETANTIPLYMKGSATFYHRMKLSAREVEELAKVLSKYAQFQEEAAKSYEKWNEDWEGEE